MVVLSAFGPEPSGVFFTGVASAPLELVPAQYPVAIAGHPYNIEPALYSRGFIPIQREARMDETEPGEVALSPGGMWRRSQSDYSLGAGQEWLDEHDSIRQRFRTSLGINVFDTGALGDRHRACLQQATEEKRNSGNTNLRLLRVDTRAYVTDGNDVLFSNGSGSEQNATWVTGWTTATGLPASTVLDIAYSGSHVYVLGGDNSIYRATPGTTAFTLYYNPTAVATRIWAGLGRLFMSDGRSLYEVTATPGETLIFTHPDPNYVMSHVSGAPTGIYITGNISNFGEVRHSWIKDDGTTWVPPVVAAEFINEPVWCCATAGKIILLGTNNGFRFSDIDGATTGLDFGPVVPVGVVRQIIFDSVGPEVYAWFTWTNIISGSSGLGRIRLSRFTEPRVPAYASDIYATSGGTVLTVMSIGGRRYFGISTDGFFGATANFVASGTLTTGRIRYGMLDEKIFSTLHWRSDPLPGGRIVGSVTFDDGTVIAAGAQSAVSSLGLGNIDLGARRGEWIEITFTLERDGVNPALGPCLRWWHTRALPAPDSTQVFLIPLRLYQKEQTPLGPIKAIGVFNEIEFLAGLMKTQQIVAYQEGRVSYSVHINNLEFGAGNTGKWSTMDHRMEGICMVEARTVE